MPAACYANPYPAFQPAMRIITAITQSNPAVVTTSFNHQYVNGTIVRLDIPIANGMQEITGTIGIIGTTYILTVASPTTFSLNVDSTNFTPYVDNECAMVIPVGEVTSQFTAATYNVLPYPAN